jgi:hypothetical protein
MAHRLKTPFLTVVAVTASMALLAACGGASPAGKVSDGPLAARKTTIGGLEVIVTPTRLDTTGAEFTVVFDTHTGAPEIDVAARSALVVDGSPWATPTWSGDGLGGHHRSGTLRFVAMGPARGVAQLTISGLDSPLQAIWNLP